MKLPKILIICGKIYKIKTSKKISMAFFDIDKQIIVIGLKGTPEYVEDSLLHEAFEILLYEKGHRYYLHNSPDEDFLFTFYHKDYGSIVADLLYIVRQIFKMRLK